MKEIDDWRSQIDEIDSELLHLLSRRARIAIKVACLKRTAGLALRSPDREFAVISRASRANPGPLGNQAVERLFRTIVRESRRAAADAVEDSVKAGEMLK